MRLTVSGLPGSGKTTVAELLAEKLGLRLILTGQVFREQARQAGMDVHEYNRLAEGDRSIDERLDEEIVRRASEEDGVIVEGRLAGHLLRRAGVPAFKVFVTASARTRAERIAKREGTSAEQEMERLLSRELSEKKRYDEFYGVDLDDMSAYDLVVDSGDISAEEVAEIVAAEARKMCG